MPGCLGQSGWKGVRSILKEGREEVRKGGREREEGRERERKEGKKGGRFVDDNGYLTVNTLVFLFNFGEFSKCEL